MTGAKTLLEMSAVVTVGIVIGLVVNAFGDSGLDLGRDYFRSASHPPATANQTPARPGTPDVPGIDDEGYQLIDHNEVVELHESNAFLDERCIFIDARDDAHYADGHIPGAYQLDHYRIERYLDTLLPACTAAEKIVVYCNGGKCEDSKLAAGDLIEQGVDPNKVFVYTGGVGAWQRDGLPFERGERLSGDLVYQEGDEP